MMSVTGAAGELRDRLAELAEEADRKAEADILLYIAIADAYGVSFPVSPRSQERYREQTGRVDSWEEEIGSQYGARSLYDGDPFNDGFAGSVTHGA